MPHALLSPSAAHRWLNCPAAPRLEATVKDKSSDFAAEGSLAHAYCALKLKTYLQQSADDELREINELHDKYYAGEMDEYTDTYKSIVLEKYNAALSTTPDALLLVETRLDFGEYIPDAFGTADAIIIADGTMEVIDFKYGKGVRVEAEKNPQMMIYALGAYDRFAFDYRVDRIRMTIVQPRIDNLSEYELATNELLNWAKNELAPKAKIAYEGNGPQNPGAWCQFCKVKNNCRVLANKCVKAIQIDAELITAKELAEDILPLLPTVKTWLSGVEDYALSQALSGVKLPGWKIVEGRSVRKIIDQDAAVTALNRAGYKTTELFKPQELRSLTELEKLVGKKQFSLLCKEYIDKPKGKPTLAPESDKRQAINPIMDDFKDIDIQ